MFLLLSSLIDLREKVFSCFLGLHFSICACSTTGLVFFVGKNGSGNNLT